MASTVTVRLSKSNFNLGLRTAKKAGGKYNPSDQTWDIPANCNNLNHPNLEGAYGWVRISPATVADVTTTDQSGSRSEAVTRSDGFDTMKMYGGSYGYDLDEEDWQEYKREQRGRH